MPRYTIPAVVFSHNTQLDPFINTTRNFWRDIYVYLYLYQYLYYIYISIISIYLHLHLSNTFTIFISMSTSVCVGKLGQRDPLPRIVSVSPPLLVFHSGTQPPVPVYYFQRTIVDFRNPEIRLQVVLVTIRSPSPRFTSINKKTFGGRTSTHSLLRGPFDLNPLVLKILLSRSLTS